MRTLPRQNLWPEAAVIVHTWAAFPLNDDETQKIHFQRRPYRLSRFMSSQRRLPSRPNPGMSDSNGNSAFRGILLTVAQGTGVRFLFQ